MSLTQKFIIAGLVVLNLVMGGFLVAKFVNDKSEPTENQSLSVPESSSPTASTSTNKTSAVTDGCGDNKGMPAGACKTFEQLQSGAEAEAWASDKLLKAMKESRLSKEDYLPDAKKLVIVDGSWSTTVMTSYGIDGTVCAEADGSVFAIGYNKENDSWKIVTALLAKDRDSSHKTVYSDLCPEV